MDEIIEQQQDVSILAADRHTENVSYKVGDHTNKRSALRAAIYQGHCIVHSCSMRVVRRKKALCCILAPTLVVVSLMFAHTLLINNSGTDVHDLPLLPDLDSIKGQLRYLNFVVQDNTTHPEARCQPVDSVAFVKTHKAGSSTIANILQRYGVTHYLNFALPNTLFHVYAYNYISKPGEILTKDKIIPLPKNQQYNILFNHAIYNRTAFRQIMPQNTTYITILRDPFQQFVSAFEYYHVDRIFAIRNADIINETNPISAYLANPVKFEKGVSYFSYIKNKQAEDLGMGRGEYFYHEKRDAYIAQMDQDFGLVMILEYVDESLLLLKRNLCWQIKDVLYIPKNTNRHKPYRNFTKDDYQRHRLMSHLDYSLYTHFLEIFESKLKSLGEEFKQELNNFKTLLEQVKQSCLTKKRLYVKGTKWHNSFVVTERDCDLMMLTELAGLDYLFSRAGRIIRPKP